MDRKLIADYLGLDEPIDEKYFDTGKISKDLKHIRSLIDKFRLLDENDDVEDYIAIADDLDYYVGAIDDVEEHVSHLEERIESFDHTYNAWSTEVENRLENDEIKDISELELMQALKGK